jgi:hypothetical protein
MAFTQPHPLRRVEAESCTIRRMADRFLPAIVTVSNRSPVLARQIEILATAGYDRMALVAARGPSWIVVSGSCASIQPPMSFRCQFGQLIRNRP